MQHLIRDPIDIGDLLEAVADPAYGGTAVFVGRVRNHHAGRGVTRLEYSAYEAMADREAGRIVGEAERQWPATVKLQHRVGHLEVGDVAVVVAVGSAHRDAAFAACRFVIEEVKRRVPIWKREMYTDGSVAWVDPTAGVRAVPAGEGT